MFDSEYSPLSSSQESSKLHRSYFFVGLQSAILWEAVLQSGTVCEVQIGVELVLRLSDLMPILNVKASG